MDKLNFREILLPVVKSSRLARRLPKGSKFNEKMGNSNEFRDDMNKSSGNILGLLRQFLMHKNIPIQANQSDLSLQYESLSKYLNSVYLDIDISLDNYERESDPNNNAQEEEIFTPVEIEKPQIQWIYKPNNSKALFQPNITKKPNSLVEPSLQESLYNREKFGNMQGFQNFPQIHEESTLHPYAPELNEFKFEPFQDFLIPNIPSNNNIIWISTTDDLYKLVSQCEKETEVAVKVYEHKYRSYLGFICYIVITNPSGQTFIIDCLSPSFRPIQGTGDDESKNNLEMLNVIFTNPNILKVFYDCEKDVLSLQRDFGVYVYPIFDISFSTSLFNQMLTLSQRSLPSNLFGLVQALCKKSLTFAEASLGFDIDWRIRPLPSRPQTLLLEEYTRYLIPISRKMRKGLHQKSFSGGKNEQKLLRHHFNYGKEMSLRRYEKPTFGPSSYYVLRDKYFQISNVSFRLDSRREEVMKNLYDWRDGVARDSDENCQYVLKDILLLKIVRALPSQKEELIGLFGPPKPYFIVRDWEKICQYVIQSKKEQEKRVEMGRIQSVFFKEDCIEDKLVDEEEEDEGEDEKERIGIFSRTTDTKMDDEEQEVEEEEEEDVIENENNLSLFGKAIVLKKNDKMVENNDDKNKENDLVVEIGDLLEKEFDFFDSLYVPNRDERNNVMIDEENQNEEEEEDNNNNNSDDDVDENNEESRKEKMVDEEEDDEEEDVLMSLNERYASKK